MEKYITNNENETIEFAYNFAKNLKKGDIIILSGELGSGKTKFVQGVLKYFNLEDEISSPTFTIVNEYIASNMIANILGLGNAATPLGLKAMDEFYAIGGEEYFSKGICIFEWGEILESELKDKYIKISYEKDPINLEKRTLYIEEVNS